MQRVCCSLLVFGFVLCCSSLSASGQITLLNSATAVANPFVTTVGSAITIDPVIANVGTASVNRAPNIPAQTSYLPTGVALNPASGFTIQFWYYRTTGTTQTPNPDYVFGDAAMVAPAGAVTGGAFRCFAGGAAGAGNIVLRGVSNEIFSVGAPLTAPATWVHLAFTYDPMSNLLTLLVNGMVNAAAAQVAVPFNWMGTNLTAVGYNGSTTAPLAMNIDDLRVYGFARANADVAADFMMPASGLGPSGMPNVPDAAYFDFEGSVSPHVCSIGTDFDATGTGMRVMSTGTILEWGANSPNLPGLPATGVVNLHGVSFGHSGTATYPNIYRNPPPLPVNYSTAGVPGMELGHGFSVPLNPGAVAWPDGLNLGTVPGLFLFSVPGPYFYQTSPNQTLQIPPGLFQEGDRIDIQFIAPDPAYPSGIATSNRTTVVYSNCAAAEHCHIEARGVGSIQVTGFWEAWNTGGIDISRIVIDLSTATGGAAGFDPAGFLNSGGTLAAGTSYRFNSEVYTGLMNQPPGYLGSGNVTLGAIAAVQMIQFDFNSFGACTDAFIWDATIVNAAGTGNLSGSAAIGATVTVTFTSSAVRVGTLQASPTDPNAAVLDI